MLYRVVLSGEIRKGFDQGEVKRKVAALYKTDVSRVEGLFTGRRVALGREMDRETALRRKAALEDAGAVCSIEPVPAPVPVEEKPSPQAAVGSGQDGGNHGGNHGGKGGAEGPRNLSGGSGGSGGPGEPATVTPVFGPASVFYSPMKCPRITGAPRGINLNRADAGEVPYGDIRLASVYSARENDRAVQRLLLFLEGRERPFVADTSEVRYADFPGMGGDGAIGLLRAFLAHLCEANPSMMVDAASLDFLRGGQMPLLEKDEDALSAALARALSPEGHGHMPGGAGLPDANAAAGGRKSFRRAGRGRPGERTALRDAVEKKGSLFAALALAALAVVAAVLIAMSGGESKEAFASRDEFVMGHLKDACMAAMRLAIRSPEETVTLEKLGESGYAVPEGLQLTVLDGTWHSFGMSARHRKGGKSFVADKHCRVVEKTAE